MGAGVEGMKGANTGAVWTSTCAALRGELGDNTFGSWIAQAQLRQGSNGILVVVTPTGIARDDFPTQLAGFGVLGIVTQVAPAAQLAR